MTLAYPSKSLPERFLTEAGPKGALLKALVAVAPASADALGAHEPRLPAGCRLALMLGLSSGLWAAVILVAARLMA